MGAYAVLASAWGLWVGHDGTQRDNYAIKEEASPMPTRPSSVTIAVILQVIISLANVVFTFLLSDGVPAIVVYGGFVLGVLGLIGAVGLWALKRWAVWLTILVSVLNILSAAPGIAFAPTPLFRFLATVGVVAPAVIILLVVLPVSRRAYT
jgi:hypothetical protein